MCGLSVDGLELHGPVRRRGRVLAAFCELRAPAGAAAGARAPGSAAHDPGPGLARRRRRRVTTTLRRVRARVQFAACTCAVPVRPTSVQCTSRVATVATHFTLLTRRLRFRRGRSAPARHRHATPDSDGRDRADRRGNPVERISYASIRAEWHPVISRPRLPSLQTNRRALRGQRPTSGRGSSATT